MMAYLDRNEQVFPIFPMPADAHVFKRIRSLRAGLTVHDIGHQPATERRVSFTSLFLDC